MRMDMRITPAAFAAPPTHSGIYYCTNTKQERRNVKQTALALVTLWATRTTTLVQAITEWSDKLR